MSEKYSFDSSGIIISEIHNTNKQKRTRRINKFFLTEHYNKHYFDKVLEHMKFSQFKIMKDDIKNYNTLTEFQIGYLINLNEDEKIEIIKMYNSMVETIKYLQT